ncbi:MAG: hypothetical protein ACJ8ER_02335 [Allosphingosinicella sp.]
MAYDYLEADRRLDVSGSLPWKTRAEPLSGVVPAVLLGLGGRTLLHGAALQAGGAAFALLGGSGQGKSTLAAALVREGGVLVSEDLLVPVRTAEGWRIEPGARSLHLLADAFAALAPPGPRPVETRDGKYAVDCGDGPTHPVPLAGLCLLDPPAPGGAAELRPLSGRRALMRLAEHLYGAWIRPPSEADLRLCAALVQEVGIWALSRPWGLEQVPGTAAMLMRHFAASGLSSR